MNGSEADIGSKDFLPHLSVHAHLSLILIHVSVNNVAWDRIRSIGSEAREGTIDYYFEFTVLVILIILAVYLHNFERYQDMHSIMKN